MYTINIKQYILIQPNCWYGIKQSQKIGAPQLVLAHLKHIKQGGLQENQLGLFSPSYNFNLS